MSFKLFVFYCAVCGGWFALAGWALGRALAPEGDMIPAVVKGTSLGLLVALGLGLVDALWNLSTRRPGQLLAHGLAVALIGGIGAFMGSAIGQKLKLLTDNDLFVVLGWTLTGLLIGSSFGLYDTLSRVQQNQGLSGALKKMVNGILGGALGGFLGSLLYLALRAALSLVIGKPAEELLSSSLAGFVALGACIGLFIGLAQVILKEAWLRVEAGFRPGRELILTKTETTIGRAESCDVGLFGDHSVERVHCRIVQEGDGYVLADAGTPGGTFLNEQRLSQTASLRSGDAIRIGRYVIRFGERQKRQERSSQRPGTRTAVGANRE